MMNEPTGTKATPETPKASVVPQATIIRAESVSPNPALGRGPEAKPLEVVLDLEKAKGFDVNTVIFMLYLRYRNNEITRRNLKQMFDIINSKHPENIAKFLVEEAAKI
jgi:hypothetical protein